MDTPFGLRRHLLLAFPEVKAATVSMPSPQHLAVRYVPNDAGLPSHDVVEAWVNQNHTAGIGFTVERVPEVLDADLPASLLEGSSIPLDVAEDAAINVAGIYDHMRRRWPNDFVRLDDGPVRVNCVVASTTPAARQAEMQRELSLLLHGVQVAIIVDTKNALRQQVASRAELAIADDWDRMCDLCNDAIASRYERAALKPGAFAYLPLKPGSLYCHLAVAGLVYVEIPTTMEEMQARHGVSWTDFVDAMGTGRVVPVFRRPAKHYARGMIDTALSAGGRYILPGENRLRELATFAEELPWFASAAQLEDRWRSLHVAVRQHPAAREVTPFFDAIAQAAARARLVARRADFMAKIWAPIAFAIDDMRRAHGHGHRDAEFNGALDVMIAAHGCGTRPIVADGELLGQYVQLLYGAPRGHGAAKVGDDALVREPAVVAKIVLERIGGVSLRQLAESFDEPAMKALHRLIQSPRLADENVDTAIADIEREMHEFNGRRKRFGRGSVGVDVTLALASLSAGWGLIGVAATVLAKHLIAKSVVSDELMATWLRVPKEAAYLARIDAAIKNQ